VQLCSYFEQKSIRSGWLAHFGLWCDKGDFSLSKKFDEIILETATLGPDPTPAIGVGGLQWVGAKFSVHRVVEVEHIGVNLAGAQTIFGAIIRMSGGDDLPAFSPDQIESFALAGTTFTAPAMAADVSVPLSVRLRPGDYGVIFGVGAFGSGGGANLTLGNQPTSQASFFTAEFLNAAVWLNQPTFTGLRIFVLGFVEPITLPVHEPA
jgi:hypothetical protein